MSSEIDNLPKMTAEEIRSIIGDGTLIVAELEEDESDIMTDYHGSRTARRVVIGVRKTKRESFAALRKAAANFPETAEYAPGKDIYTVRVVLTSDIRFNGAAYWKESVSHWHGDIGSGKKFATKAEAEAFIKAAGKPHDIRFGDQLAGFEWEIDCESYEHRENYSMGGGNYLGTSRYSGWKVRSTKCIESVMEIWSL